MKSLIALLLFFSPAVFAAENEVDTHTQNVEGTGRNTGFCDGSLGTTCVWQLKDQTERFGRSDVDQRCSLDGGRLQSWSVSCYTDCSPSYIGYNEHNVYVSCRSDCRGTCELPN